MGECIQIDIERADGPCMITRVDFNAKSEINYGDYVLPPPPPANEAVFHDNDKVIAD